LAAPPVGFLIILYNYTTSFSYVLTRVGWAYGKYESVKVSKEKIEKVLKEAGEDAVVVEQAGRCWKVIKFAGQSFIKGWSVLLNGESGSGKTSLMNMVANMGGDERLDESSGAELDGKKVSWGAIQDQRYYILQQDKFISGANVIEYITGVVGGKVSKDVMKSVGRAWKLACCNFGYDHTNHSGGQEQRVILAKAFYNILTRRPTIVLGDEIDKGIDLANAKKIFANLKKLARELGFVLIVSTHIPELQDKSGYDVVVQM
jgi:putative ABC transport system ATP-binding protein